MNEDLPDSATRWPRWRDPDPFVGVFLSAAVGILAADRLVDDPWKALGVFLAAVALWLSRPRAIFCLSVIAAAFGAAHAFSLHSPDAQSLADALNSPQSVHAAGAVIDEPRNAGVDTARFTLRLRTIEVAGEAWPCHARVLVYWKNGHPACGDDLDILGQGRNIAAPRNPGEFDFAKYEWRQGIRSQLDCRGVSDVRVLVARPRGLPQIAGRLHDWMRDTLVDGLDPGSAEAAIVSTMLLGLREEPGLGEQEAVFQRTGTLHYFAIDGLKLALLSCLAIWALQRAGVPRMWARTICLPPLAFYALATGFGPASVRATVIAAIVIGAFWLDRGFRPLNALAAAAAGILFFDTNQLFDLGFQLTFAVVLAVILLAGRLHQWLLQFGAADPFLPPRLYSRARRVCDRLRHWGFGLVSVAVAAWLGSLPIMILRFNVIAPVSPIANVVTFPIAWLVLALGVAALCVPPVALWFNRASAMIVKLFLLATHSFDAIPGGSFYVADPAYWTLRPPPAAELTVLDLGVNRAIHLQSGNVDWLIDAGQRSDYAHTVRPYLHARGINRLEGLILSQADTRHLGAAALVLDDLQPPAHYRLQLSARALSAPARASPRGRRARSGAGDFQSRRQHRAKCRRGAARVLPAVRSEVRRVRSPRVGFATARRRKTRLADGQRRRASRPLADRQRASVGVAKRRDGHRRPECAMAGGCRRDQTALGHQPVAVRRG